MQALSLTMYRNGVYSLRKLAFTGTVIALLLSRLCISEQDYYQDSEDDYGDDANYYETSDYSQNGEESSDNDYEHNEVKRSASDTNEQNTFETEFTKLVHKVLASLELGKYLDSSNINNSLPARYGYYAAPYYGYGYSYYDKPYLYNHIHYIATATAATTTTTTTVAPNTTIGGCCLSMSSCFPGINTNATFQAAFANLCTSLVTVAYPLLLTFFNTTNSSVNVTFG